MALHTIRHALVLGALGLACSTHTWAAERVTVDNFARAESDFFMKKRVDAGMFGKLVPVKNFVTADNQTVVRSNHDVLFTYGVFDLTEPVTITLPDTGSRYQSMRVINEDHYIKLLTYKPGRYVLDQKTIGSRYAHVAIRLLADANDPADMAAANALQDQMQYQQAKPGAFEVTDWDVASQAQVRKALVMLAATQPEADRAFGDADQVDPVQHLMGTAAGWGGGPADDAMYLNVVPTQNDGSTPYELSVGDVPVDAFWSVTVYNQDGYFQKNPKDLYSYNNLSAKKDADGKVTIRFGGDPAQPNYLPIVKGWNYTVRLYRPRQLLLDGGWTFTEARPVK